MPQFNSDFGDPQFHGVASREQALYVKCEADTEKLADMRHAQETMDTCIYPGVGSKDVQCILVDDIVYRIIDMPYREDLHGLAALNGISADLKHKLEREETQNLSTETKNELARCLIKAHIQPIGIASTEWHEDKPECESVSVQTFGVRTLQIGSGMYGNESPESNIIYPGETVRAMVPSPDVMNGQMNLGAKKRVTLEAGPAPESGSVAAKLRAFAEVVAAGNAFNDATFKGVFGADGDLTLELLQKLFEFTQAVNAGDGDKRGFANTLANNYGMLENIVGLMFESFRREARFNLGKAKAGATSDDKPKVHVVLDVGGF